MVVGAGATYAVTSLLLSSTQQHRLTAPERLDIACFEFLAWWWIAYFSLSHIKRPGKQAAPGPLFTLRSYLDEISSHRLSRRKVSATSVDEQLLREKTKSSRDVQGIMIAVVVLLLTLIVIVEQSKNPLTEYQHALHGVIFGVALVTILSWILSMDIFDTVLNSFQVEESEAFNLRRYFYRKIGPLRANGAIGFSGAVSYGYLGHALMPVFVLMVFSWFQPELVGFATALYVVLAYPYYFGYWAIQTSTEQVTTDDVKKTELESGEDWIDLGNGRAEIPERWQINRDGDTAVITLSGEVSRGVGVEPHPHRWPIMMLGLGFLIASIAADII
jgi:hypothetical protein